MKATGIVKADRRDLEEILQLQHLAYQSEAELLGNPDIPPLRQTLEEVQAEWDKGVILKAVKEGRIVGSARGYARDGTAYIGKLMVRPDLQGEGLGTRLLKAMEAQYPGHRYELFTSSASEGNLRLYRRMGYREFTRVEVSPGLVMVYLEKAGSHRTI